MKLSYCNHAWPISDGLQLAFDAVPPLADLKYFHENICRLHENLGIAGKALKETKDLYKNEIPSSLDQCRAAIDAIICPEDAFPRVLRHLEDEELKTLQVWALACLAFVSSQKKTKTPPPKGLPVLRHVSLSFFDNLQEDAVSLLRDLAILYNYCAAKLRQEKWVEHSAWFLFLLRFWDEHSVISSSAREGAGDDLLFGLLKLHQINEDKPYHDCPPNCLKSFLSFLHRVNPGALLEAIALLGGCALSRDKDWEFSLETDFSVTTGKFVGEQQPFHTEQYMDIISETVLDLDLNAASFFLNAIEPFGVFERRLLLDVFGVANLGVEIQDLASAFAAIAHNVSQGRTSPAPVDRLNYFQRAIEVIGDIGRGSVSQVTFLADTADRTYFELGDTLDAIKTELRAAIIGLPISPHLLDRRWVTETFYFAFLVDHENFWQSVFDWCHKNRDDLKSYRETDFKTGKPRLIGPFDRQQRTGSLEATIPVYVAQPAIYRNLNEQLMEHIVRRFRDAWPAFCGTVDFDFRRAYAYWKKGRPHSHYDVYHKFGIKPEEPSVPSAQASQAVDHQIFADMDYVAELAGKQKKRPFYVIVSGDGGYGGYLEKRREQAGIEYQYWFFQSIKGARSYLGQLPEARQVKLEDILKLDEFRFSWWSKTTVSS